MHHDAMARLIVRAQEAGGVRLSPSVTEWDVAGNCQQPVQRELHVRPGAPEGRDPVGLFLRSVRKEFGEPASVRRVGGDRRLRPSPTIRVATGARMPLDQRTKIPLTLRLTVRCRRCDACRRRRAMFWRLRAQAETQAAVRTWFGTLTLRPELHQQCVDRARTALAHQGVDFDALPFGEQFTERCKYSGELVTKYLKRVRKDAKMPFRFLCVTEHHKSGLPHYHLLVHEAVEGSVKHATLRGQWDAGFCKWVLVQDLKQASYLCKYLSKATVARVRASVAYGEGGLLPPLIRENSTTPQKHLFEGGHSRGESNGVSSSVSTEVEAVPADAGLSKASAGCGGKASC